MTTFTDWSTLYYINYYGCNEFSNYYQYIPPSNVNIQKSVQTHFGSFYLPYCSHPKGQPLISSIIFVSFEFLAGFGVVSMCLAAVALGINEKLSKLRSISLYGESDKMSGLLIAAMKISQFNSHSNDNTKHVMKLEKLLGNVPDRPILAAMLNKLWEGQYDSRQLKLSQNSNSKLNVSKTYKLFFTNLSIEMKKFISLHEYKNLMIVLTVCDVVMQIIVETINAYDNLIYQVFHLLFALVFLLDSSLIIGSHMTNIYELYQDPWALFNIVSTIILALPALTLNHPVLQIINYFEVARIFRILQPLSKYFEDLGIILGAVYGSVFAVCYVICVVSVCFAYYGIAGVLLFKQADPFYFGDVIQAYKTLLQIMTLDNWNTVMRNSVYGCYLYGYSDGFPKFQSYCKSHDTHMGMGWISIIYFLTFIILAAIILNSLLVGVIITSMELLKEGKEEEKEQWRKVSMIQDRYFVSQPTIDLLLELFEKVDVNHNACLTFDEMKTILDLVFMPENDQYAFFVLVDTDHSGKIDFSEFCEMMILIGLSLKREEDRDNRRQRTPTSRFNPSSQRPIVSRMHVTLDAMKQTLKSSIDSILPAPRSRYIVHPADDLDIERGITSSHMRSNRPHVTTPLSLAGNRIMRDLLMSGKIKVKKPAASVKTGDIYQGDEDIQHQADESV